VTGVTVPCVTALSFGRAAYSEYGPCHYLLSIKSVYRKPGGKVWYNDQREVYRHIFVGDGGSHSPCFEILAAQ
jgi:hypothetical protein